MWEIFNNITLSAAIWKWHLTKWSYWHTQKQQSFSLGWWKIGVKMFFYRQECLQLCRETGCGTHLLCLKYTSCIFLELIKNRWWDSVACRSTQQILYQVLYYNRVICCILLVHLKTLGSLLWEHRATLNLLLIHNRWTQNSIKTQLANSWVVAPPLRTLLVIISPSPLTNCSRKQAKISSRTERHLRVLRSHFGAYRGD